MDTNPFLLIKFSDDINQIINQPLQLTQRIKYTCFDVSQQYIVFGASSGALYLFNRQPYSFIQLIPNQEGAITHVHLSPNEKTFAFSTAKGFVCTISYAGISSPLNLNVFREHTGSRVTDMKWNAQSSELYVGDNRGKISVITLSDFLAKTMFQTPSFTLMSLDSQIVQIDWNSNLLLISTLTRCYVCDTVSEKYRQIGVKLRDGEYGACFINFNENTIIPESNQTENVTEKRGLFNSLSEGEMLPNHAFYEHIKLFCARPGSRFWEVKIDGTVVKTHQFKHLLAVPPCQLILLDSSPKQSQIKLTDFCKVADVQSLNFSKVLNFKNKFLLAYRANGIFIFDPVKSVVVLWTNYFKEILDIKIFGNYFYVWHNYSNSMLNIISFSEIEKFVLQCYVNKQYELCAHLCLRYNDYLTNVLPNSNKLHLLCNLSDFLSHQNDDLFSEIHPFIEKLKTCRDEKQNAQKLTNGIYIMDNDHFVEKSILNENKPLYGDSDTESIKTEPIEAFREIGNTVSERIVSGTKTLKEKWQVFEDKLFRYEMSQEVFDVKSHNVDDERPVTENTDYDLPEIVPLRSQITSVDIILPEEQKVNNDVIGLYQYYKLSKNKMYNNPSIDNIIKKYSNIDVFFAFLGELKTYREERTTDGDLDLCCYYLFLQYISIQNSVCKIVEKTFEKEAMIEFLISAFKEINCYADHSCTCGFPLPFAHKLKIRFEQIGYELMKNLQRKEQSNFDICNNVPYMWKYVLDFCPVEDNMNLLIQYNDPYLLDLKMSKFQDESYQKTIELFIKFKNGICLKCGESFTDECMSWSDFGIILVSNYGSDNTLNLLMTYGDSIPSGELNQLFYQFCIFASMVKKEGNDNIKLNLNKLKTKIILENDFRNKFQKSLEKILSCCQEKDGVEAVDIINHVIGELL